MLLMQTQDSAQYEEYSYVEIDRRVGLPSWHRDVSDFSLIRRSPLSIAAEPIEMNGLLVNPCML